MLAKLHRPRRRVSQATQMVLHQRVIEFHYLHTGLSHIQTIPFSSEKMP
jgi:hypothetical protein